MPVSVPPVGATAGGATAAGATAWGATAGGGRAARRGSASATPSSLCAWRRPGPPHPGRRCGARSGRAPRSVVGRDGVDEVGVFADAPIPGAYLRASEFQRRELLAGLLDLAGTIAPDGDIELSIAHPRLLDSVGELLTSLGLVWRVSPLPARAGAADRIPGHAAYTLVVRTDEEVFRLSSKALLHKDLIARRPRPRTSRVITAVRRVPSVPVRCIEVDNADHLYLAGRAMIPTHNSTFGMDVARCAAIKHRMPTAIFSLEMSRTEISMRVIAAEGTIQLQDLRKGTIGDAGWAKIAKVVGRISDSPLFIDDSPNMSLMEIRAKCRRLKQQHQLQLVVIDYLQLMSSGKQLNRGPEQRTDKRPQMSDLRESGSIEQDADVVILLHKDREREGEADVLVVKHRNGPTKDLVLGFQGHYARFANMAPSGGF
ncbi:MAG: DnaB-like helicase C-terminal domain-containing protein [Tetrasphaera sp.]|nr:DnaB-like helicase C-terminal domain-containing protein [Tetrasphaera sp.]